MGNPVSALAFITLSTADNYIVRSCHLTCGSQHTDWRLTWNRGSERDRARADPNWTRPDRLEVIPFPFAWTGGSVFTPAVPPRMVQRVILSKRHGVGRHLDRRWTCQIIAAKLSSVACTCRITSETSTAVSWHENILKFEWKKWNSFILEYMQ